MSSVPAGYGSRRTGRVPTGAHGDPADWPGGDRRLPGRRLRPADRHRAHLPGDQPRPRCPTTRSLSTIKSKEYKGSRANELRIDDTTAQISAALMSDHGASAPGLPDPSSARRRQAARRGASNCAPTNMARCVRPGAAAEHRGAAQGRRRPSRPRRRGAGAGGGAGAGPRAGRLRRGAPGRGARRAPQQTLQEAVRDLGHGANDESGKSNGGKPAIALSGPAGIAAATPASLTLAAGEQSTAWPGRTSR